VILQNPFEEVKLFFKQKNIQDKRSNFSKSWWGSSATGSYRAAHQTQPRCMFESRLSLILLVRMLITILRQDKDCKMNKSVFFLFTDVAVDPVYGMRNTHVDSGSVDSTTECNTPTDNSDNDQLWKETHQSKVLFNTEPITFLHHRRPPVQ
jgi:hypothetical protein